MFTLRSDVFSITESSLEQKWSCLSLLALVEYMYYNKTSILTGKIPVFLKMSLWTTLAEKVNFSIAYCRYDEGH